jgi:hypothetical protein
MLVSISEVKQRRARLGLGWVTVLRKRSRYLQTFHKWKRSLLVPAGAGPETIIAELRYYYVSSSSSKLLQKRLLPV